MSNEKNKNPGFFSLWREFIPLSMSDVTMACGDPAVATTLAHLPDAQLNLAALGIAKSVAVFFESPIIMILHASNALSSERKARQALWHFTLISITLITGIFGILLLPGVFPLISGTVLGVHGELAARSKSVLLLLLLWPAAIGCRRFFQGALIHFGYSKEIAQAGLGRLFLVLSILAAGYVGRVHGYLLAGTALVGGVLFEALIVTWVARDKKNLDFERSSLNRNLPSDLKASNLKGIWKYYWPLANSMLIVWGGRALLVSIIARANDASVALAVWPTAWSLVLVVGNATRMVQQVIIKNRHSASLGLLVRFTLSVGSVYFLILFGLATTKIGASLVSAFIGDNAALLRGVIEVLLICSSIPFFLVIQNALQGFLISEGKTSQINKATWLSTFVLSGCSVLSIALGLPGARTAAMSMVLAFAVEVLYLWVGLRKVFLSPAYAA